MRRLTEPLLSDSNSDIGDLSSDPETGNLSPRYEEDEFETQLKPLSTKIKEVVIFLTALSAVISSLMYMAVTDNIIAYLSSIFCCIIASYSYYQQKDLYEIQKLNEACKTITRVVEEINIENFRLTETLEGFDRIQDKIGDVQDILDLIEDSQEKSMKQISKQIDTNQEILNSMEKSYRVILYQNVLLVMKVVDADKDGLLSDKEMKIVFRRLKQLNGFVIDENIFKAKLDNTNRELWEIMDILKEMYEPYLYVEFRQKE